MNKQIKTVFSALVMANMLALTSPAHAQDGAMTVETFLATAADIPRNPSSLFRSDARRLLREVQAATRTLRDQERRAREAGRTPATCLPPSVGLGADAIIARFSAIPPARRGMTVTQAMREWMAEAHPCS